MSQGEIQSEHCGMMETPPVGLLTVRLYNLGNQ